LEEYRRGEVPSVCATECGYDYRPVSEKMWQKIPERIRIMGDSIISVLSWPRRYGKIFWSDFRRIRSW